MNDPLYLTSTSGVLTAESRLFHYTSIRGVEGILLKKTIWASLLHFMNDSREWLYSLDLAKQSITKNIKMRSDPNWTAFIAEVSDSLDRIAGLNVCVFSLTTMRNQLSQWRAYCPPEGGYNLEFAAEPLRENLNRHGFELKRCIYDPTVQQNAIDLVVEQVLNSVGALPDDNAIEQAREIALSEFSMKLSEIAPVLKHPDFKEEQEWRAFALVLSTDKRMSYRVKGSVAIPHCLLDLQPVNGVFPVVNVTIGPNTNQVLAMRGLQAIIWSSGERISTTRSTTPLRNL